MAELIAVIVVGGILLYALQVIVVMLFMFGYCVTIPALSALTGILFIILAIWHWKAPHRLRWGVDKSDIKALAAAVGGVLSVLWIIATFSNWNGAGEFFETLGNWMFHRSM